MSQSSSNWLMSELAKLAVLVRNIFRRFLVPNPLDIKPFITGEFPMPDGKDIIQFKVILPLPPVNSDVVGGELTVTVDGVPTVFPTTKDQTEVLDLEGPQDSIALLEFVFVDDAGNRSVSPAQAVITLADTVPPADPGALGVIITGERHAEAPVTDDAPASEEPAAEEPAVETPEAPSETPEAPSETPEAPSEPVDPPAVEDPVAEEPAAPVETEAPAAEEPKTEEPQA
jgi:hypothetical protein